jgi:Fic family protein
MCKIPDTNSFMTSKTEILIHNTRYDSSSAVGYHYGGFPPQILDQTELLIPLADALTALTRYDTMLRGMVNSELLLAPLRARDAVVSSRMEGTISTIEEVLRLEADADEDGISVGSRDEALEVALYVRALRQAEHQISDGYPISENLIRQTHRTLLSFGRGKVKHPGTYKSEQNYIGERRLKRIDFIPISPEQLPTGMSSLIEYIKTDQTHPLIRIAISHAEFEALHPFEDGNGRLGRMLITLMLWNTGILSAPRFFVSDYFEKNKDEYIERLRAVSQSGDWISWCTFFFEALHSQALENIEIVGQIQNHYDDMRERFRDVLRSRWSMEALDYVFENPIFRNNRFTKNAGISKPTAYSFTNKLVDEGLLRVLIPPAGRAPGLYVFPSLLEIVQEPR